MIETAISLLSFSLPVHCSTLAFRLHIPLKPFLLARWRKAGTETVSGKKRYGHQTSESPLYPLIDRPSSLWVVVDETMSTPSPRSNRILRRQMSEGPIAEFVSVIEHTPSGNWQKRATAFQKLIDSVPEDAFAEESGSKWYNTPAVLRHLALSIGDLLKDPRSSVVKRTCMGLTALFARCKVDARYLFKDLMPTVLSVHAQTVQIIRQAVETMIIDSIVHVPCKMVMPLWMERLRIDRSRTVRDACALYLGHSLQTWTEEGYLTDEIWFQVGRTLLGSVRDPSPNVRAYSKQVLEQIQRSHPEVFDKLLNDEDGPAGKDMKLYRWLKSLGQATASADAAEDLSVASRFSYNSDMRMRSSAASVSSGAFSPHQKTPRKQEENSAVPISISVQPRGSSGRVSSNGSVESSSRKMGGIKSGESPSRVTPPRHPAKRTPPGKSNNGDRTHARALYKSAPPDKQEELTDDENEELYKQKSQETEESNTSFPSDLNLTSWRQTIQKSVESSKTEARYNEYMSSPDERKSQNTAVVSASTPETPHVFQPTASTVSALANDNGKVDEGEKMEKEGSAEEKYISSVETLKKFSKQRSRSSLLIQERLRMSTSMEDDDYGVTNSVIQKRSDEENNIPNPVSASQSGSKPPIFPDSKSGQAAPVTAQQAPEHMVIAIRLLRAHKEHVDAIMETLRIEMDTLRDFDQLLEEAGRPTEEEVLDYYESVGLCLEQRSAAGARLQQELDLVSRGEPPME